ncbi:MAG TPA: ethanolamine ammonia lyase-activating protein [Chloroflexota bacterium]|nr:ethanolamine ammonia lyase-activating protein [Chloroflexota bacterium]
MQDPDRWWHRLYYDDWVAREGLELIRGHRVEDVFTQPLRYWPRTDGYAVHIALDGAAEQAAAYVQEIPPTRKLNPQRHMFEELVYILKGRGSTSVWYDEQNKRSFEWGPGSLFAIPLNAWFQHYNLSGTEPARYIATTTAPTMMNFIRNDDFIFNNDFRFTDRFAEEEDYFNPEVKTRVFEGWGEPTDVCFSNLWPDISRIELYKPRENSEISRGIRTRGYSFELANGVMGSHILEAPGGTFTKLHRHGPAAHVLWIRGEGYSVLWPDGGEDNKIKEDWKVGTLIVPPTWWWHQHCITSREPGRHLALKLSSRKNMVSRFHERTMVSTKKGGQQMDYDDIPPETMAELKRIFLEECAKKGTPVDPDMGPIIGG